MGDAATRGDGAALTNVDGLDRQRGFRFELNDQIIDVLAPDDLVKATRTAGKLETIQIPAGRRRSSGSK